jgi:hypothetical protein
MKIKKITTDLYLIQNKFMQMTTKGNTWIFMR